MNTIDDVVESDDEGELIFQVIFIGSLVNRRAGGECME
jgi:hypothetical protein